MSCIYLVFAAASFAQSNIDYRPNLKENIRVPDKWEIILETATEDESKVQSTLDNFRSDGYSKLLKYNNSLCVCNEEWKSFVTKYDLLQTSLYLPLIINNGEVSNCTSDESVFEQMSEFDGTSANFIDHLREIWGKENGFENFLYEYRISMRLIENFDLPTDCKKLKKTHTVLEGQTLYRLSVIYGVSVESIQDANDLSNSTQINSGSVLVIP